MTAGYLLRRDQTLAARSAAPCDCGHPHSQHLEYGYSWKLQDGELVEVMDPRHEAGLFHCRADGCDCELRR